MEQSDVILTLAVASASIVATKLLSLGLVTGWRPSGFVEQCLKHTPGTMISALIIPDLLSMGALGVLAALVTTGIALASRSMLATVVGGALIAMLLRSLPAVAG